MSVIVREDLAEAHRLAWAHLAEPAAGGPAAERIELAGTALLAISDPDPLPPWVGVTTTTRLGPELVAPLVAHDIAYRLARHAGTFTGRGVSRRRR